MCIAPIRFPLSCWIRLSWSLNVSNLCDSSGLSGDFLRSGIDCGTDAGWFPLPSRWLPGSLLRARISPHLSFINDIFPPSRLQLSGHSSRRYGHPTLLSLQPSCDGCQFEPVICEFMHIVRWNLFMSWYFSAVIQIGHLDNALIFSVCNHDYGWRNWRNFCLLFVVSN